MIENGAPGDLGRRARRLLGLATSSTLLVAVVYLVFVRTAEGQRLDDAALGGRGRRPPEVVHGALDLLATVDAGSLVVAALAVAAVGYRQGRLDLAAAAGGVILGATATTELLKRAVLDRPALLDRPDPFGAENSLPSGHATVAMAIAMALVLTVPPASRTTVALITGAYAVGVGTAAITAGWHRPSDVVAAYLVVAAWAAGIAAGLVRRRAAELEAGSATGAGARRPPDAGRNAFPARDVLLLGGALTGLAATLVALGRGDLAGLVPSRAYAVGVAAAALAAVAPLTTFTVLLRGVGLDSPTGPRPDDSMSCPSSTAERADTP